MTRASREERALDSLIESAYLLHSRNPDAELPDQGDPRLAPLPTELQARLEGEVGILQQLDERRAGQRTTPASFRTPAPPAAPSPLPVLTFRGNRNLPAEAVRALVRRRTEMLEEDGGRWVRSREHNLQQDSMTEAALRSCADSLRDAHGMVGVPVDPFELARGEGILLSPGEYPGDFDGCIEYVPHQRTFLIYYQMKQSQERQRFTVAHELGHYSVPWHRNAIMAGERHGSQTSWSTDEQMEREADVFAANLLMPAREFRRELRDVHLDKLTRLAAMFGASLTATAHRMIGETSQACSVVFSDGHSVRYAKHSETIRRWGVHGIRKGTQIPAGSLTADLSEGLSLDDEYRQCRAELWYTSERARRYEVWESVKSLGRYGYLTLLVYEPE